MPSAAAASAARFYSDYTFGCWDGDPDPGAELLPVGKAYFGFTDEELKWLDRYVRRHTVNRFGPVRETDKSLVFEVAFDSVHESKRHKSGLAMRFPRISRIRSDKPAHEADRIETLRTNRMTPINPPDWNNFSREVAPRNKRRRDAATPSAWARQSQHRGVGLAILGLGADLREQPAVENLQSFAARAPGVYADRQPTFRVGQAHGSPRGRQLSLRLSPPNAARCIRPLRT